MKRPRERRRRGNAAPVTFPMDFPFSVQTNNAFVGQVDRAQSSRPASARGVASTVSRHMKIVHRQIMYTVRGTFVFFSFVASDRCRGV